MSKIVPANEAMVRDLKPQPKMPSNGCCLGCCGKASGPVDVSKIVADGGKFLQTSDGRIVEYFVYGAEAAERTLVQIAGSMATGWFCMSLPGMDARLKSLNLKAVSVTLAGHGYTSWQPNNFRVCDYAKDVEAVLAAEGITGPLLLEGSSYGCALALACARHFGERVTHLHVHTAYIPYELRVELGMQGGDLKTEDDACLDKDTAWVDSCGSCCLHCCCTSLLCLLRCNPALLDDAEDKALETAAPGYLEVFHRDVLRCSRGGSTAWGLVHNFVGGVITKNWGFDLKTVSVPKVMISYNEGDPKCPPAHAQWLIEHFRSQGSSVVVNVGDNPSGKIQSSQHGRQMPKMLNGEFLEALVAM